ncbi:hypothetical protein O9K63_09130 [Janibacter cremeus]|uniref:hypothetical protein n=1 Tax=Janibacter cremeus TaxID=1285192 RepID=UPI0023F6FC3C|nr:hypothetical protein [Janibacter cremeus]WEV76768.1 hypothetical protein O9K63_09130 [Janibacter cremeus]
MDPPESYVDTMPCDPDVLVELGRVTWAAARLHAGVRDLINCLDGAPSDHPFGLTLGQAITELETRARAFGRHDVVDWVHGEGRPANKLRNAVVHVVTYTAADGKQAIQRLDTSTRFQNPELRTVTRRLIAASMLLPT